MSILQLIVVLCNIKTAFPKSSHNLYMGVYVTFVERPYHCQTVMHNRLHSVKNFGSPLKLSLTLFKIFEYMTNVDYIENC